MAHAVYRMFSADNELLYVGCTGNLPTRLDQHRTSKPWWSEVAAITVEHYDRKRDALRAERAAIASESPTQNVPGVQSGLRAAQTRRAKRIAAHAAGVPCHDGPCMTCEPIYQRNRVERSREAHPASAS